MDEWESYSRYMEIHSELIFINDTLPSRDRPMEKKQETNRSNYVLECTKFVTKCGVANDQRGLPSVGNFNTGLKLPLCKFQRSKDNDDYHP